MSEEEQEAIKEVKSYVEWVKDRGTDTDKHIEIILNLIDRLQKENEELKEEEKKAKIREYNREYKRKQRKKIKNLENKE